MRTTQATRKWEKWERILTEWRLSNDTVSNYCRKNKIPLWQFYYWKRKLGGKGTDSSRKGFIRLSFSDTVEETSGMWIELSSGHRLIIQSNFKRDDLSRVLKVLGDAGC